MTFLKLTSLVDKFIKSATFQYKYTERAKRILTLIIIPIWLFALVLCIIVAVDGIKGIFYYNDAKKLLKDIPLLEKNRNEYFGSHVFGETRVFQGVDNEAYKKVGIEGVEFWDDTAPYRAIRLQEDRMYSFIGIPIIFGIFCVLPWLILRLFFWITKADNETKI